jgi:glutamyl-Q tRNA(Asp) synthetase
MSQPVFRFAPSPNGELHLGHALSAILNSEWAARTDGRFLLRIEDIDLERCTPEYERGIYDDLAWLGIGWEKPARRQSEHFADYKTVLDLLIREELVYPSFMSRSEIRAFISEAETPRKPWPRDPDGVPLYPGADRELSSRERRRRVASGTPYSWRLDVAAALGRVTGPLSWTEVAAEFSDVTQTVEAHPAQWGDVVLARRDVPTSYHLSVVLDDAAQGVSHVVRGRDLLLATSIQRLLQELLSYPAPAYFHHPLVEGPDGRKLSKSENDTGLKRLRDSGATPVDIRRMVGLA